MRPTSYSHTRNQRSSRYSEDPVPSTSRSRTEEEIKTRREEWRRQQELEMEHERLKRRKIEEWERKRAQELGKRSPSDSPPHHHTGRSSPIQYLSTFKEKSNGEKPLFKGPEGAPINSTELCRIQINISRNIPIKGPIPEIKRDIPNIDDVIIWRRDAQQRKKLTSMLEVVFIKLISFIAISII
ncbi:uncharacterized protein LOC109863245 isoform X2 [Pseudomyrmex gracilis]|uniref:uncharacterized protein LOC109863245 isoform X2 n=1 Tax=Pseudomyrmex gracilis TaxID=219809 RepID=UPI0009955089|nr:uncharacterized protein LOC109863245 isoform X2 [Pseudomyrmex gracilis]